MTEPSLDYEQLDLTQSSEVQVVGDTKTVNYQVLFNHYEQKTSLIQEFRITSQDLGTTKIELIGQKWIKVSKKSHEKYKVEFQPLLNSNNQIEGTQLLIDDDIIQLKNKESDWHYEADQYSSKYKIYKTGASHEDQYILVMQVKL